MAKEHYIIVPRSIFTGEAWKNATLEQKGAIADLCASAAYCEFDYECKLGTIHLQQGQLAVTMSDLAEKWKLGINKKNKAKSLIDYMQKNGFLTANAVFSDNNRGTSRRKGLYTVLTINALHELAEREFNRETNHMNNKKKNNKKKNPPKPPSGADSSSDFSSDFSSEEVNRCKAEVANIEKQLFSVWQKIMEDKIWPTEYYQFMPERREGLCNTQSKQDDIKNNHMIPAIRTFNQRQAYFFIEHHLCFFINTRSSRHTLSRLDICSLTSQLLAQSADLTIAQISLFFYLLDRDSPLVGPPQTNGTLTADHITSAFSTYLDWLRK